MCGVRSVLDEYFRVRNIFKVEQISLTSLQLLNKELYCFIVHQHFVCPKTRFPLQYQWSNSAILLGLSRDVTINIMRTTANVEFCRCRCLLTLLSRS